jgi:predicted nucleic acid-binding Zn ribbon protein
MQQTIFTCALCGNQLQEKPTRRLRKDAIYCSKSCRTRANNERRRLRRMEKLLKSYLIDVSLAVKNTALEYDGRQVAEAILPQCFRILELVKERQ